MACPLPLPHPSDDAAVLDQALQWLDQGLGVALATVVATWGSAPRPVGSHLAITADGAFAGSVSGGCVEGAVITEAQEVIAEGKPRTLSFGVSDERAWEVGLACGGTIRIFVEALSKSTLTALQDCLRAGRPTALVTELKSGAQAIVGDHVTGTLSLAESEVAQARSMLATDASGLLGEALFVRSYGPPWSLVVVGAAHIGQALAPMALLAGYSVLVIDPRPAFAAADRFPGIEVVAGWPDEILAGRPLGPRDALVTLGHDAKIDDPALMAGLNSPAFFVGALGSPKTHAKRCERLLAGGLSPENLARLAAPVGLDIGSRTPGEIAVSIIAEVIAARRGKGRGRQSASPSAP